MDFITGSRYLVCSNNNTNKCICKFIGKSGESYKFQVIGKISAYERSEYNINTTHKDGKIIKINYDELIDYDDPVSVYLISTS